MDREAMNYDVQIHAISKIMSAIASTKFVGTWKTSPEHQRCPEALLRCTGCDGSGDESNDFEEFEACIKCLGSGKRASDDQPRQYGWGREYQ